MTVRMLEKFDTKTANGIIAAAALSVASGGLGVHRSSVSHDAMSLLSEARETLSLSPDDQSPRAASKLSAYLGELIKAAILDGVDPQNVLLEAAQSGRLSPLNYHVGFADDFSLFGRLGTPSSVVRETILTPDDVQHLLTELPLIDEPNALSLFMKLIPARGKLDSYWSLVQTVRRGFEQIATAAWRVYSDDVSLIDAKSPIDVLKRFVEVFGVPVTIGMTTAKFIDLEHVPANDSVATFDIGWAPAEETFTSITHRKGLDPSLISVGIGYCINIKTYRASLIRHGVSAR